MTQRIRPQGIRSVAAALLALAFLNHSLVSVPAPAAPSSVRILWALETPGQLIGTPALGDVDGDGIMEVVVADATAGVLVVEASGSLRWAFTLPSPPCTGPLLADLDGGRGLEIVLVSKGGEVHALSGDRRLVWSFSADTNIIAPPAAADLDRDGLAEIIAGTEDGRVIALNSSGRLVWSFATGEPLLAPPLVFDPQMVGRLSVAIGTGAGKVMAISGAGHLLWCHTLPSPVLSPLAAGDMNMDGLPEIAAACTDGTIHLLGQDCRRFWSASVGSSGASSLAVADVDSDGKVELLAVSSGGGLTCLAPSGALKWAVWTEGPVGPLALYSTGDERRVVIASGDGRVRVFNGVGKELWSANAPALNGTSCVIADIGGAGEGRVYLAGDDRTLYCLRSGEPAALGWPQLQHDPRRSGNLLAAPSGALPGSPLWSSQLGSAPLSTPEVADLRGTGGREIVVLSGNGRLYALSAATGLEHWSLELAPGIGEPPAPLVADVNADAALEVVASALDGSLTAARGADGEVLWTRDLGARAPSPSSANFDDDAELEVVLGTSGGELLVLSGGNGSLERIIPAGARVESAAAIGDLDGDGRPDIALPTQSGVVAISGGVSALWVWSRPGTSATPPALGDLSGDGLLDVVFGTEDGRLVALSGPDGLELWSWKLGSPIRAAPVLVDVPGGAPWDVVAVTSSGAVGAFSGDTGRPLWTVDADVLTSPAAADMDGNGLPELFLGANSGVLALSSTGKPLWRFRAPRGVSGTPAISDLDCDGSLELIVPARDGVLYCVCAGGQCGPGEEPWPSFRHDMRRTGNPYSTGGGFLPDLSVSPSGIRTTELLPTEGSAMGINVTVRNAGAMAAGPFDVALYIDGTLLGRVHREEGLAPATSSIFSFSWLPEGGDYVLRAVADESNEVLEASEANNAASIELRVNFRPIARAGPDVRVNAGGVVVFDGSASSDPDGVIVDFNWSFGDGSFSCGERPTHRYLEAGLFVVTLKVTDDCGAVGVDELSVTVNAPPRILRWWPEGDVVMSESSQCEFRIEAFDPDGDPLETGWTLDGERAGEGNSFTYLPSYSSAGRHLLTAEVSDGTGADSHTWSINVIDSDGPIISWYPPEKRLSANTGQLLEFSVILRSPGPRVRWLLDGLAVAGASGLSLRVLAGALSAGLHTVTVEVNDGGHMDAREWELRVFRFDWPPEFCLVEPGEDTLVLSSGGRQIFTALVRDRDSAEVRLQWYLNGAAIIGETSMEYIFAHRGAPGLFNVTVVASDGERSATHSWSVRVNRVPTALVSTAKRIALTGEAVGLDASGSFDPDGEVVKYSWHFGDGYSCTTASPSIRHVYARPGVYIVELTVTDDLGFCSTARVTVVVLPESGSGGVPAVGAALAALAMLIAGAVRRSRFFTLPPFWSSRWHSGPRPPMDSQPQR
ncbi:MAG: PKD domain-containing protein [Thermoplasmata archaeon]